MIEHISIRDYGRYCIRQIIVGILTLDRQHVRTYRERLGKIRYIERLVKARSAR